MKRSRMPLGVCTAFDRGIPKNIFVGNFDHNKKHPEQKNNILFEPKN